MLNEKTVKAQDVEVPHPGHTEPYKVNTLCGDEFSHIF